MEGSLRALLFLCLLLSCTSLSSKGVKHPWPTEPMCIAATLKSETSFTSMRNARAVLDVIKTRMEKTGMSACKVVLANRQFSGMTMKKVKNVTKQDLVLYWSVIGVSATCKGCTHFHSGKTPAWAANMQKVRQIAGHTFYKDIS